MNANNTLVALTKRRILIVDDHPVVCLGLARLIDSEPDLEICGEACTPDEAFRQLSKSKPDLLLTDLTMPGRSGFEFVRDVLALQPNLSILVVSMHDEMIYAERALRAGARGYIMKESGGENIIAAIRLVLRGQVYLSPKLTATFLDGLSCPSKQCSASPVRKLSDREFEVLRLLGQGNSTRDIALQLHLSIKTVDAHRANIKQKLNLKNATELVSYAIRWTDTEKA